MTGKIAGSRIVYARTTVTAAHDEIRRMQYAYGNGVVIYLNGRPLVFAMNPGGLRSNLGVMAKAGDAVYLPLKRGTESDRLRRHRMHGRMGLLGEARCGR